MDRRTGSWCRRSARAGWLGPDGPSDRQWHAVTCLPSRQVRYSMVKARIWYARGWTPAAGRHLEPQRTKWSSSKLPPLLAACKVSATYTSCSLRTSRQPARQSLAMLAGLPWPSVVRHCHRHGLQSQSESLSPRLPARDSTCLDSG